ncbi:MAG TPA: adenylate/guanylate cyclase domain-containing protein, partial [Gaiellaceae bacterium]|nr:adenylate/guanylate cyclase domain-containing protein [Gaiellaceae bacterium]
MRGLPTGTVTFLFADVEGSTALQQDSNIDYAAAVALLRRLLRDAVAAHGGTEADAVGDEYVAVFAEPAAGADAAFAAQRALRDTSWPGDATVRIRIG